ncbi:MAG: GNAT family N-acetyltransferase [Lachnospiraceae bacterium]|nr:GNAT family N-acetyltransferase [Lachnospiraceae bacterium]
MHIQITNAVQRDIAFIAKVCREMKELYDPIMEGASERQAKRYEEGGLPGNYNMRIISFESSYIGFEASKKLNEDVIYLVGFYLLKEYQRKGLGKETLNILKNEAKSEKIKRIILLVHSKANWAIDFYVKNGFRIVGRSQGEVVAFQHEMNEYYINNTCLMCCDLKYFL